MKSLRFHVINRHGSVLAAFVHETDAKSWAANRASATYQTPHETFRVLDMSNTTKAPNGRRFGETIYEFESKGAEECPL